MKRFTGFVIKECYHIIRDYRTMIVLIGIPVVQMLLFGFVITNEIKDAKIAVLDKAKDEMSARLINKITSSGYFILDRYLETDKGIHEIFKKGDVMEVIIIEPDFARRLSHEGRASVQVLADASEPNNANMLVNYTQGIIRDFTMEQNREGNSAYLIRAEVRMAYNPGMKGVFMFVPGIMAMLLTLISALMTSISITREKELGTMEVLLVSPLRPLTIILGKVTPYVLLSFFDALIILLVSYFIFDVPVRGSIILLLLLCMLYIITALSVGILISALTRSQQVAMVASLVGLMLPTILLSGFIYPIENMPLLLQGLCQVMPPRWFIAILKDIMLKGNGLSGVWQETLVLAGMTALFIIISVKKFKIRLE